MGAGKGGFSAGAVYNPAALSGSDRLMMLGAALKDASNPDGPSNVIAMRQMLGQRQQAMMAQQALQGWVGGQGASPSAASVSAALPPTPVMQGPGVDGAPIGQRPAPIPASSQSGASSGSSAAPGASDLMRNIALSVVGGFDPTPFIKGMEFNQPHYGMASGGYTMNDKTGSAGPVQFPNPQYVDHNLVDPNSRNAPTYIPLPVMGTIPDGKGGLIPQAGYADSVKSQKAAETAGQQAETYADMPLSDGTTQHMTNAEYAARTGRGDPPAAIAGSPGGPTIGPAGSGAPPTAASVAAQLPKPGGQSAPVLGVTQNPAQAALILKRAETQATREAGLPAATHGLEDEARTSDLVRNQIRTAVGQIGGLTTGLMANTAGIAGTPAYNLAKTLDMIKANVGFDRLQAMRDSSPTGGALGRVTQQEINLLQSVEGSLNQGQGSDQLKTNLNTVLGQLDKIAGERQRLYQQTYGAVGGAQDAPAAPSAPPARSSGPAMAGRGYRIISVK